MKIGAFYVAVLLAALFLNSYWLVESERVVDSLKIGCEVKK